MKNGIRQVNWPLLMCLPELYLTAADWIDLHNSNGQYDDNIYIPRADIDTDLVFATNSTVGITMIRFTYKLLKPFFISNSTRLFRIFDKNGDLSCHFSFTRIIRLETDMVLRGLTNKRHCLADSNVKSPFAGSRCHLFANAFSLHPTLFIWNDSFVQMQLVRLQIFLGAIATAADI